MIFAVLVKKTAVIKLMQGTIWMKIKTLKNVPGDVKTVKVIQNALSAL
jgi:hypothetical protein